MESGCVGSRVPAGGNTSPVPRLVPASARNWREQGKAINKHSAAPAPSLTASTDVVVVGTSQVGELHAQGGCGGGGEGDGRGGLGQAGGEGGAADLCSVRKPWERQREGGGARVRGGGLVDGCGEQGGQGGAAGVAPQRTARGVCLPLRAVPLGFTTRQPRLVREASTLNQSKKGAVVQ